MPQRPDKGFDLLASLPWPVGILLGLLGFLAIRYGIPWQMGQTGGPVGEAFASGQVAPSLNWLALGILGICWLAAGASFFGRRVKESGQGLAHRSNSDGNTEQPAVCRCCGSPVELRGDDFTGEATLECTRFPNCRETMPLQN